MAGDIIAFRHVAAGHIANFAARLCANHAPRLLEIVNDPQIVGAISANLVEARQVLGIQPGQMAYDRPIGIPVDVLDGIEVDRWFGDLWGNPDQPFETYAEIDVIYTIERFVLWVAIGLQFLNFRYSWKHKLESGRELEVGLGTSGFYLGIKDHVEDVLKGTFSAFSRKGRSAPKDIGEVGEPIPEGVIPNALASRETLEAVGMALSDDVSSLPQAYEANLLSAEAQNIGGLFKVDPSTSAQRKFILAKLASLYWDVNSAPRLNDGIPTAADVFTKDSLSKFSKDILARMPRGYTVDVGERVHEDGQIRPFVCVSGFGDIPGSRAKKHHRFVQTKAGLLTDFIRGYVGDQDLAVYFVNNSSTYHFITGSSLALDARGARVRGLVLNDHEYKRWGIFPGHVVLDSLSAGIPLEDVCSRVKSRRVLVEDSSGFVDVGSVERVYLTNTLRKKGFSENAIDAAFAVIDKELSTVGIGNYIGMAPNVLVGDIGDLATIKGRYAVTKDPQGNIRWGFISAINATLQLESRASGHAIRVTHTISINQHDQRPFAMPGMSGSLVFLTPVGTRVHAKITGELILLGYLIGARGYSLLTNDNRSLTPHGAHGLIPNDFFVQPIGPVMKEFNKFCQLGKIGEEIQ